MNDLTSANHLWKGETRETEKSINVSHQVLPQPTYI